ncbi:MAG: hypothetical protein LBL74_08240 [Bacteroidales bacterium]|jgi:hypothetical protein|nr:hypothetical protein [Bacteroidales bacterium]
MKLIAKIGKLTALNLILLSFAELFSSCASGSYYTYDDVYTSGAERAKREVSVTPRKEVQPYNNPAYAQTTEVYTDTVAVDSTQAVTQSSDYSSYDEDDYYDYAYAARIRRFHRPFLVYDYYDDYYTNLYWYTYNPLYWGISIYLGYNWWYPSYYYSWGYNPYYWGGYYHPYYGYHHHHYHNHHWGHNHYDRNHHISYYNSHDRNSNFYRPTIGRNNFSGSNNRLKDLSKDYRSLDRNTISSATFGDKYNARFGTTNVKKPINNTNLGNTLNKKPVERENLNRFASTTRQGKELSKPALKQNNRLQKPVINNRTISNRTITNRQEAMINNNRSSSVDKKVRNNNSKTYVPPSVRQPRSTTEFRHTPSTTRQSSISNRRSTTTNQRSINVPQRSTKSSYRNKSNSSYRSSSTRSNNNSYRSSSSSSRSSGSSHSGGSSRIGRR